jgi:hypothetical protein
MKKYKHPAGYTIEYDEKKFTKSPNGTLFPNVKVRKGKSKKG